MSDIKLMQFIRTPAEKYLGIAQVLFMGKILLRYKIVQKKDGINYFPTTGSIKTIPHADGKDAYIDSFQIDSNSLDQEIRGIIMEFVNAMLSQSQNQAQNANLLPSQYGIAQPMPNLTPVVNPYQNSASVASHQTQPNPNYYPSELRYPELMEDPTLPF